MDGIKFEAIDIFSGCGGFSCGLTLAGFKVKAAVEIDRSAVDAYQSYPPLSKVKVLHDDICRLSGNAILKIAEIKEEDIYLFGGCPPCQNFSRQNPENKNKPLAERVFPAHAGVNRHMVFPPDRAGRIPRTRGGEPPVYFDVEVFDAYSPHTRG